MFAKSFLALDGNGRLTGARTAQKAPYERYTCHLCHSPLLYHPANNSEQPWFEHISHNMTENGQQHCPYAKPDKHETRLVHHIANIFV